MGEEEGSQRIEQATDKTFGFPNRLGNLFIFDPV